VLWRMQKVGRDMGDYVTAARTETDENRTVKTPGAVNGGFFPRKPEWPAQYPWSLPWMISKKR